MNGPRSLLYAGMLFCALLAADTGAMEKTTMSTIYDFTMNSIDGTPISLADFKGKVILVVNVASRCGFTGQYAGLEKLYRTYKERGLVILGFPANDFLGQEPGTNEEIKQFCARTYDVTFPMFAKISVKGKNQHPLYRFLTEGRANPDTAGAITWNFNKFLVGKSGAVAARFGTRVDPQSKEIVDAIEKALAADPAQ